MAKMNVLQALNAAMAHELEHDPDVLIMGQDVGTAGGIFRTTQGLQNRFGRDRVIDTPLDEKGIVGHAIGLALFGMKPIAEIQFSGFIHDCVEQVMFAAAKYRWITGGEYTVPLTIRAPSFGGIMGGIWHSHSPESYFAHGGGIKIVAPSTPQDAYGLLLAAIRDPDPVLVLEPVALYRHLTGEVETDGRAAEIGKAEIVRAGKDLTAVVYGPLRHRTIKVADKLAIDESIEVEVIDLRTLIPFDLQPILDSVRRTGRLAIIHEAPQTLGFGAEIAACVQAKAFEYFEAPIIRICAPDTPYSYRKGDELYIPNEARILAGFRKALEKPF
jgi:pyruvate dehydrogenase E1 component beta subunit